jgi:hypothetical protein
MFCLLFADAEDVHGPYLPFEGQLSAAMHFPKAAIRGERQV